MKIDQQSEQKRQHSMCNFQLITLHKKDYHLFSPEHIGVDDTVF